MLSDYQRGPEPVYSILGGLQRTFFEEPQEELELPELPMPFGNSNMDLTDLLEYATNSITSDNEVQSEAERLRQQQEREREENDIRAMREAARSEIIRAMTEEARSEVSAMAEAAREMIEAAESDIRAMTEATRGMAEATESDTIRTITEEARGLALIGKSEKVTNSSALRHPMITRNRQQADRRAKKSEKAMAA